MKPIALAVAVVLGAVGIMSGILKLRTSKGWHFWFAIAGIVCSALLIIAASFAARS